MEPDADGNRHDRRLLEGQMGIDLVIGHFVGKPANDVRKQMGIIGDLNVFLIDLAAAVLVLPNQIPLNITCLSPLS